jgi:aminoglycoside phosphotransferase (APT) family kinase protein
MTELIEVREQHRFDEAALQAYLLPVLPEARAPISVRQFQGGQSNPTFLLADSAGHRYVLRKKPPGAILPSAHAVEREYAAMRALRPTGAPVPDARVLCEDAGIIGTPFYVMDFLDGRVLTDLTLPEIPKDERAAYYFAMADGLAALHRVDWRKAGLEGFGRPDAYLSRQIARWTKQYLASDPEPSSDMDNLIAWLPAHLPPDEPAVIAHGDYRLGNLMFAQDGPRLLAILDWELATIGHPMADLAYLASFYHLPRGGGPFTGLGGADLDELGIPDEAALVARYCAGVGRAFPAGDWPFYLAFSLFRSASIGWGVFDRSRRGNAADKRAHLYGEMFRSCARTGWALAQKRDVLF